MPEKVYQMNHILLALFTVSLLCLCGCTKTSPTAQASPVETATPSVVIPTERSGPLVEMLPGKEWRITTEEDVDTMLPGHVIEPDFTADLQNNMTAVYFPNGDQLVEKVTYHIGDQEGHVIRVYKVEIISPTQFKATEIEFETDMNASPMEEPVIFSLVER